MASSRASSEAFSPVAGSSHHPTPASTSSVGGGDGGGGAGAGADTPGAGAYDEDQPESTVAMLERLSAIGVQALNDGDHDFSRSEATRELRAHIAPDWRGQIDTYAHAREVTLDEQTAMWDQRRAENPNVHFHIMGMTTDIDEAKGEALIFLDMEVTGLAEVTLQAMNELTWRRIKGEWFLWHTLGLRGTRGNTGGFG